MPATAEDGPASDGEGAASTPRRAPFAPDFPEVVIQQPWDSPARPKAHTDYAAAKAGDTDAAFRFVQDMLRADKLDDVRAMIGNSEPVIVAVHAEEATGRNKIPLVYAAVLGDALGLPVDEEIVQANRPQRRGRSNLYRLLHPVEFDGAVLPGQACLLVDDHVSQGGTLADLRSYIAGRGGKVVGATTLTGIPGGQILAPLAHTLDAVRRKLPGIDAYWKETFGHDIAGLTEQETRYLLRFNALDSLRNQLVAGGQAARHRPDQGTPG